MIRVAFFLFSFFWLSMTSVEPSEPQGVSLPTEARIAADLVGRKLSEGVDNGYFSSNWIWTIEEREIRTLTILRKEVSRDYCSFDLVMTLQSHSSPTKYRAKVQVDYSLMNNKWKLIMVKSKGVSVVKTGKYDDSISTKIDSDGWGGVNCLKIKNNTDVSLLVGGVFLTNESNEWHKFSLVIEGLKVMGVGGTFSYGSVIDYRIHFVEPN